MSCVGLHLRFYKSLSSVVNLFIVKTDDLRQNFKTIIGKVQGCEVWWLIGRFDAFCPKVAVSNPALARKDLEQVLHSQLPVALRRDTPTQSQYCVGSPSE